MSVALRLNDVHVSRVGLRRARARAEAVTHTDASVEDGVVLEGVSLEVERGSVLALLGTSGGGKTTLLRLLNRLTEPDRGEVAVFEKPVRDWDVRELRREAVFVGQQPVLFGGTVADELAQARSWAGRSISDQEVREALTVARLEIPSTRDGEELSGGERVRLGLARALLLEPKALLLDEPTGSLDVRTARELLRSLVAWAAERGVTLLVVTHRPEDLRTLGGQAAVLLDGRLLGPYPAEAVADGSVDDPAVRAFLEELPAEDTP